MMAQEQIYEYQNPEGKPIFEVVRIDKPGGKDIFQRVPDGCGGYINSIKQLSDQEKHIPYRLPKLIAAQNAREVVLVVEGEKCVHAAEQIGYVATCNSGGAGKWTDRHSSYFKPGLMVWIIVDNDPPGRDHGENVAASLSKQGCRCKVIELPGLEPKGDIADFVAAGKGKRELVAIGTKIPEWKPMNSMPNPTDETSKTRIRCMSDVPSEEVEWLFRPYLPLGKLSLVQGDPGEGKTFAMMAIAAAITNGMPINDIHLPQGNVIYQSAEDGIKDTLRPRFDLLGANANNLYYIDESETALNFEDLTLLDQVMAHRKPKLVVFDPIQAYFGAGVDTYRANEVRPLLANLGNLAAKHGAAVVAIMHLNKSSGGKAIYRGLGSIDLAAAARSVLLVGSDPSEPANKAIVQIKSSLCQAGEPLGFTLSKELGFRWTGHSELTASKILSPYEAGTGRKMKNTEKALIEYLSSGPKPALDVVAQVMDKVACSERTVRQAKANIGIRSIPEFGKEGIERHVWFLGDNAKPENE